MTAIFLFLLKITGILRLFARLFRGYYPYLLLKSGHE